MMGLSRVRRPDKLIARSSPSDSDRAGGLHVRLSSTPTPSTIPMTFLCVWTNSGPHEKPAPSQLLSAEPEGRSLRGRRAGRTPTAHELGGVPRSANEFIDQADPRRAARRHSIAALSTSNLEPPGPRYLACTTNRCGAGSAKDSSSSRP